jgi:hypothetical protein
MTQLGQQVEVIRVVRPDEDGPGRALQQPPPDDETAGPGRAPQDEEPLVAGTPSPGRQTVPTRSGWRMTSPQPDRPH